MRLRIDNKNCSKKVKNIKIKLERAYLGREKEHVTKWSTAAQDYLVQEKDEEGVAKGETAERVINLKIPLQDFVPDGAESRINSD